LRTGRAAQVAVGTEQAAPVKDEKPAYKLSVNDMVIKALALALRDVPEANVSWTDEAMVKHKHADVGVAVSIPGGLITPIMRQAEKAAVVISNEMKDLGKRAKDRKLQPQEYQGGTTAVSNMGMMGVKDFSAVVNPPHATILAVGAGEQRPVVKDGALAIAQVMTVTLSTDHRCVDGALGAELLGPFKGYIENPMSMLVIVAAGRRCPGCRSVGGCHSADAPGGGAVPRHRCRQDHVCACVGLLRAGSGYWLPDWFRWCWV
jgi:pyruvate dehydrogenase E2 component (dihydrolipoamide acetyltransferase)